MAMGLRVGDTDPGNLECLWARSDPESEDPLVSDRKEINELKLARCDELLATRDGFDDVTKAGM